MTTVTSTLPVAVIGAGPVGLAAAAHLVGRGLTPLVFEAGASVATHLEIDGGLLDCPVRSACRAWL
jgi:flavin-dependent dehydrogenase